MSILNYIRTRENIIRSHVYFAMRKAGLSPERSKQIVETAFSSANQDLDEIDGPELAEELRQMEFQRASRLHNNSGLMERTRYRTR